MAATFGPPGPTMARSVLVHDPFDQEAFEDVLPRAPGLRLLLESEPPEARDLAFDLFCSFYKYFVKLLPADAVVPERRRHRDLIGRALELREHEKLRAWTRLKPVETALAAELVLDHLLHERGPEEAEPAKDVGEPGDVVEPEDLFYSKLVTHQLLIYELSERHPQPRPVYLCLDNSGSMSGEKEIWAKASALALSHLALQHGRSVEVVLFGDAADPLQIVSLHPQDKGPERLEKVMEVASYLLGGGTDFQKPLAHVLDAVGEGRGGPGTDVLFVSDGLCPLPEDFVRRFIESKARNDIRLTTVVIGGEPFSLAQISDSVNRLEDSLEAGDELAAQFAWSFLERSSGTNRRPRPHRAGRSEPLVFDHFLPEEP